MTIALSLASVAHWAEHPLLKTRLAQWIERAPRLIDGYEIHVDSIDDLLIWALSLRGGGTSLPGRLKNLPAATHRSILSSEFLAIHLPTPSNPTAEQLSTLAYSIDTLHELLSISDFTVHPDGSDTETWRTLSGLITSPAFLSVENMDPAKASHQTLDEIAFLLEAVPRLKHTFDICHWIEVGNASDDPLLISFLHHYRERISKIHFSVPSSASVLYDEGEKTSHCLSIAGGPVIKDPFFEALTPSIPFIVEGFVPAPGALPLLEREARFLRSVKSAWASRQRNAA